MIIGVFIISFLMDGIVSNYVPIGGVFVPLFSLMGLIVSYEFFTFEKEEYYKYAFILGLCYDLIYTDTFVFYAFLFMFMAFVIMHVFKILASNYLGLFIVSLVCIILFRSITYFFLFITGNVVFKIDNLYKGIYSSLLINIIYGFIVKFVCSFLTLKKFNKKKYY